MFCKKASAGIAQAVALAHRFAGHPRHGAQLGMLVQFML